MNANDGARKVLQFAGNRLAVNGSGVGPKVTGFCPMGCGATLYLDGNAITCSLPSCKNPAAASDLIADNETCDIVIIRPHDFTIRHPLHERINDELDSCDAAGFLNALEGPPATEGRYRMRRTDSHPLGWPYSLERIES